MVVGEMRNWIQGICCLLLFLTLLILSVTDSRKQKIPNAVTIPLLILGGVRTAVIGNGKEMLWQMIVLFLLFLIGPFLFAPGDCKMCMGVVAIIGTGPFLFAFAVSEAVMLVCFFLLDAGKTRDSTKNVILQIKTGKAVILTDRFVLPYAPYLTFGTGLWMCINMITRHGFI